MVKNAKHVIDAQAASATPVLQAKSLNTVERFVVFLDIMGFKDRVARNAHSEVLRQLETFQKVISTYVAEVKSSSIHVALFSDSILLFSEDGNKKSLKAIASVTSKIMLAALQQEVPIPLKGAIAKGKVTCDTVKQLYFGQALIDAYMLEENVKYYGVLVHHSAEKDARRLEGKGFRNAQAFLRSGSIFHFELDWYGAENGRGFGKTLEQCLQDLRSSVSDEPRKYIDNTLSMYEKSKEARTTRVLADGVNVLK